MKYINIILAGVIIGLFIEPSALPALYDVWITAPLWMQVVALVVFVVGVFGCGRIVILVLYPVSNAAEIGADWLARKTTGTGAKSKPDHIV